MNTGGVFNLITHDGDCDKILCATERLNKRLEGIRVARLLTQQEPMPTLQELEQTHVFFIKSSFKPFVNVASEYFKIGPSSPMGFDNQLVFEIPNVGQFLSDQVLHVQISGFGIAGADPNTTNTYRYANFPGIKLCRNTEFSIGEVKIDNYTSIDSLFQSNFMLEAHKKLALLRAVGNQEVKTASVYLPETQISQEFPFTDGAQTLKTFQPALEMWIPLMFQHNLLPCNALCHELLPWGQRLIKIDMAAIDEIISARAPGYQLKIPIPANIKSQIKIEVAELYTNCLFIGADILDIYKRRLNFSLIRIHGRVRHKTIETNGRYLLNNIKHPIEYLYVAFRPVENDNVERWSDFMFITDKTFCIPVVENCNNIVIKQALWKDKQFPVNSLSIISNGIRIFQENQIRFYEDFLPFSRGNTAVALRGVYLIPFNLKTGEQQPSGYYNISRNRETYIEWTSNVISKDRPAELLIAAAEMNFLIVKDGKAWLLYDT